MLKEGETRSLSRFAPARRGLLALARRAYEYAPQGLVNAGERIKPFAQLIRDWRVPVNIFRGSIDGGREASLLVAGAGHSIDYFTGRFFTSPPRCEQVGMILLPTLPRILRHLRGSADMTIAQVPRLNSRWMGRGEYVHVPPWVATWLRVPGDPESFARENKRVWDELRPVRQRGLRPVWSRERTDIDRFYDEMYLPYAQQRYGAGAMVRPRAHFHRFLRRNGELMWVYGGDQCLAGALFCAEGTTMRPISLGLAGDGNASRKAGTIAAIYYFGIQHAKARGCIVMDFGASRPSSSDGVVFFKRKWGISLALPETMPIDMLFRWEQSNPAVQSLLSHTPLIIRQGTELSLLAAPQDQNLEHTRRLLWMGGIRRMYFLDDHTSGDSPMPGLSLVKTAHA